MNFRLAAIFITLLLSQSFQALCSHIVGGDLTYKFMGDSGVFRKYQITLNIYEDCLNGQQTAILEDNPAYLGVYSATPPFALVRADSTPFINSQRVPTNFNNQCVSKVPQTCLTQKTFVMNYALAPNATGYIITWTRCCRNAALNNVIAADQNGSTFYCFIPPPPITNNSAIFRNFPPQIICENNPLVYDNSATDADGDSLAYGFVTSLNGATNNDAKPWPGSSPTGPPFDSTIYRAPFNGRNPMPGFPPIRIDPRNGLITGTPNMTGRFLVTVYCDEYRDGVWINRVTREFQFVVTSCTKTVIADIPIYSSDPNTYVINCTDYTVHFVNNSSGGFSYKWDFGASGNNDTSSAEEPTYTYPDTGTYTVKLIVNPGSTCPDSISRLVKVYPRFHASFIDTGGTCPGLPVYFLDMSTTTLKPVNFWSWSFGDGDSTLEQNPVHTYKYGGIYNVILVSRNSHNCADTVMKQVVVDNFSPFAGNDTVIVKGEKVQFHATGGTTYLWTPSTNLDDTTIYNPLGYYPDTGHFRYYLFVISPYGCQGYDTITVQVVNQAAFAVPGAFTPNGDGNNDVLRPISIGYRSLNYFRIFNRWGQEVYFSTTLEAGWDGTYNHKKAEVGTYFWEISFIDRFGQTGNLKGDVELIR